MFGFKKATKTATYGAIIDVGSGSVGVGIVESDVSKKLPHLIFSDRIPMRMSEKGGDRPDQLRKMREALFSASLILSKEGLSALREHNSSARIARVLVTASSPWAFTVSKNIEYGEDVPIRITETFLNDLIEGAEEEIKTGIKRQEEFTLQDFKVVERATVDVKVNGYSIEDPVGQKGKEFSLSHIVGLVLTDILDAVNEVQEKILTGTNVSAHTFMLVVYCVMRDLFPKMHSLLIVDITGESTELGVVEDDVLVESLHTNCGYNTLIRDISIKKKGVPEDALSLLRSIAEKTASLSEHESAEALKAFTDALSETLSELRKRRALPAHVVVTVPPHLYTLFGPLTEKTLTTVTGTASKVFTIDAAITEGTKSDVFQSIAARFFHKLHGCGEIDTL